MIIMHYTTKYLLKRGFEEIEFVSEKEACSFLGVARCTVASCYRKNCLCKGYKVERVGITTHRETKSRLHKIWESMIARCEYRKHPHFEDYGGRGVSVCREWHDYNVFRSWAMSNGYEEKLTIDRIDNDGNYDPSNCRWATIKEQQNNKRNNHVLHFGGAERTISEWSEITGISKTTIKERLRLGWSEESALTTPVRQRTKGYRPSKSIGARMDGE